MHRREFVRALPFTLAPWTPAGAATPLAPVRAQPDRLIDIAVGLRPFRPHGPRIEAERLHGKTVVHHYGHGGAGWSLSWGSAQRVLPLVKSTGEQRIAVIGCGAIGLTTAVVLQKAGLRVRIYAASRPPEVHSSAATGLWTPDSRLATLPHADAGFVARWEAMARASFAAWQGLLGLPAEPVAWRDGYVLSDIPFEQPLPDTGTDPEPEYAEMEARVRDLRPRSVPLHPGEHPFSAPHVRRFTQLVFNITAHQRLLTDEFLAQGGQLVQRKFEHARQLAGLPERTIVNCTGYGARALFGDTALVPVRGQTARLIPQREVDYALIWRGRNVSMVPRGDGLLVQAQAETDYGNGDLRPDRALSERAVLQLAAAFAARGKDTA